MKDKNNSWLPHKITLRMQVRGLSAELEDSDAIEAAFGRHKTWLLSQIDSLRAGLASVDELKSEVERKGDAAGDTDPLVNIRAALAALREETMQLELSVGIIHQQLGRRQVARADRVRKKSARSRGSVDSRGTAGGASTANSNEALAESLSLDDEGSLGLESS